MMLAGACGSRMSPVPPRPLRVYVPMKSSWGSVWLTQVLHLRVAQLEVLPGRGQVGAAVERDLDRPFEVDGLRRRRRQIGRHQRRAPQLVVRAADDQALERELVVAQRRLRVDQRLAAGRLVGLRLHDVNRRHRADFDPRSVVADQLRRQVERRLRRVHGLTRVDQFPVRVPHLRHGARRRRLQVQLRGVLRQLGSR